MKRLALKRTRYKKLRKQLCISRLPKNNNDLSAVSFLALYIDFLKLYRSTLILCCSIVYSDSIAIEISKKKKNKDFFNQHDIALFDSLYLSIISDYDLYKKDLNEKNRAVVVARIDRNSKLLMPVFNSLFELFGSVSNTFIFRNVVINNRQLSIISDSIDAGLTYHIKKNNKAISLFFSRYYSIFVNHYSLNDNVYGFIKNKSCVDNANYHLDNSPASLINIDINKFFNNCTVVKCLKNNVFTDTIDLFDASVDTKIAFSFGIISLLGYCTHNSVFPTGASFTPVLSNIMLIPVDVAIKSYLSETFGNNVCNIRYSRYVDDISISSDRAKINKSYVLTIDTIKCIESILNNYGFYVKYSKTSIAGPGDKKSVNNIILDNNNHKLSIGTDKKLKYKTIFSKLFADEEHDYVVANLPYIKDINKDQYDYITEQK
ncbi:hypothetical protein KAZ66_00370 [Candidatus Woesebacteria bacterium]|nr:hypothetical protein [Candidatus Woesebacteria bacterium]